MKKALVTGAAGFIGSHVVQELLKENVEVRALIRPGEDMANLKGLEVEMMEGDILNLPAVQKAMKGVDTLFHLAAIYAIWMKDWSRIYEVNMQGTQNVLWTALKSGVGRVVYTSSIAALGIAPGKALSSEETTFNQYTLNHHYIITKYLSQQAAIDFARNGLDLVVVNPCFPFGANDIAPTPTGQIIKDILSGKNFFYFNGGINIVDVRDVARGHVLAAKKGRTGEKYILGNMNVTMKEFMQLVYKAAGKSSGMLFPAPIFLSKGFAYFFRWLSDNYTLRVPVTTPPEVNYATQYLFFDVSKAQKELGLQPTPIEESLKRSIEYFRSRK
jgi:dihydroflavonol-4-reductase